MPDAERGSLAGRRLYFVGIGGSGLSAYANMARALGAEVRGWEARDTIFLGTLEGIEVDLGGEPMPPDGWEVVVSTAHRHRIDGVPRADFLAELVAAQPSIVVGGAHGKTTTAAMIAFVLHETGADPAWIIGGVVPQLGGNAGAGPGWLVVEGDESDRSIGSLRPQIAVLTNVELDHHATYASEAELRAFFEDWLHGIPHVVRSWELEPVDLALAVPGEHNRQNAAAALAALELAGVRRAEAEEAIVRFTGVDRRLELVGEARRRVGLRRLRPQPDRARGDAAHGPGAHRRARDRGLPAARRRAHAAASPRARRRARARRRRDRDGHHRRAGRPARRGDGEARRRRAAARGARRLGADARGRRRARTRLGAAGRSRAHLRRGGALEDRTAPSSQGLPA